MVDREQQPVDALVLGSGVAGLTAAIRAASDGLRVGVLTKGKLTESATRWAQGGVAAQHRGHPTLRPAGGGLGEVGLRQDADPHARIGRRGLDGGGQPGHPAAQDEQVKVRH